MSSELTSMSVEIAALSLRGNNKPTEKITSATHKNIQSLVDGLKLAKRIIMTTISLIDGNLNSDAMKIIGNWLKSNTTLTSLTLTNNQITCDGASLLAKALMVNTTLTKLNLSENKIGNRGVNAFFQMLNTNNTITSLAFSDNKISDTGVVSLENNTALTTLNLRNNKIGNTGVVSLVESIILNRGLINLDLSSNIIGDGGLALAHFLTINTTLIHLDISSVDIDEKVFDAFINVFKTGSFVLKKLAISTVYDRYGRPDYYHGPDYYPDHFYFNYDKLIEAIKYNTNTTLQCFRFTKPREYYMTVSKINLATASKGDLVLHNRRKKAKEAAIERFKPITEFLERNKLIEKIYPLMCCSQRRGMYLPDEIWTKVANLS
jgi:hypothetical protein